MIDIAFDCRSDSRGRDPDSHSPTLRRFHQLLWSKPLPCGRVFELDISEQVPKPYLRHQSELGTFDLTSDSITHTYRDRPAIKPWVEHLLSPSREYAESPPWLIAECTVFPGTKRIGKPTINGARGMNPRINDRFDLTLECIRRHYEGGESPLSEVLQRYRDFFSLFGNFKGYVDFFFFQDLVCEEYTNVRFYLPFDGFAGKPLPQDFDSYRTYLERMMAFSRGRTRRIVEWCEQSLSSTG